MDGGAAVVAQAMGEGEACREGGAEVSLEDAAEVSAAEEGAGETGKRYVSLLRTLLVGRSNVFALRRMVAHESHPLRSLLTGLCWRRSNSTVWRSFAWTSTILRICAFASLP